jgi:hypothetical protein
MTTATLEEIVKDLVSVAWLEIEKGTVRRVTIETSDGKIISVGEEVRDPRPFVCDDCGVRAKSQRGLTKHRHARHPHRPATSNLEELANTLI